MTTLPDPKLLAQRTIEALGGPEKAHELISKEFAEMSNRWEQDIDAIGRILRAHLYVEHYLTEHLQKKNPNLGDLSKTRITYAQKLELLNPTEILLKDIVGGIRHLNAIRNRLAHNLSTQVTNDDVNKFLASGVFKTMRDERAKPGLASSEPMDVLEEFAQYAAYMLSHRFSAFGKAFESALNEPIPRSD